jgi:hypothetical protein
VRTAEEDPVSDRATVLLETREELVVRVNGIPRNPEDGRHRRVIVYSSPTLGTRDLARRLRRTADLLDDSEGQA